MAVFFFDRFDDLSNWTLVQTSGTVVAANNKVKITGDPGGVVDVLGMSLTSSTLTSTDMIFQYNFEISNISAPYQIHDGLHSAAGLSNGTIVGNRHTTAGPVMPGTPKFTGIDNDAGPGVIGAALTPVALSTIYTAKNVIRSDGKLDILIDGGAFSNGFIAISTTATLNGTNLHFEIQVIDFANASLFIEISEFFIHDNGLNFDPLTFGINPFLQVPGTEPSVQGSNGAYVQSPIPGDGNTVGTNYGHIKGA